MVIALEQPMRCPRKRSKRSRITTCLQAICTKTSTGSAMIASGQISRTNSLRQVLVRAKPTDIALIWVKSLRKVGEKPEGRQNTEQDLETDPAVAALQAGNCLTGYPGAVAELSLRQTPQLAPCLYIDTQITQRPPHGQRSHS